MTKQELYNKYATMGWKTIPIVKNTKQPPKGFKWEYGWDGYSIDDYDVALLTGDIITVDCDRVPDGDAFVSKLINTRTKILYTRSGNKSFLFSCNDIQIQTTQDIFGTKRYSNPIGYQVDIRGRGGYNLIPWSGGYKWGMGAICPIPDWLMGVLIRPKVAVSRKSVAGMPTKGERHTWFLTEIGSWSASGWSFDKIINHALTINKVLTDPVDEGWIETKVREIYGRDKAKQSDMDTPHVLDGGNGWLDDYRRDVVNIEPSKTPDYTTGFRELDDTIWGITPGKLTLIAGNPNSGKSLVTQIGMLENIKRGKKCLLFSAEMTRADTINRWAIYEHGVDSSHFLSHQFTAEEVRNIEHLTEWLKTQQFHIYDDMVGIEQIVGVTEKYKPDIVYIDYFQDCVFGREGYQCAEEFVHKVRTIAKTMQIPVVLASQVHEQWVMKSESTPPFKKTWEKRRINCNDVRTTKALYHKADLIMLLTNFDNKETGQHVVLLDVGKNKINGKKPERYYELDRTSLRYKRIDRSTFYAIKG